MARPERFELPTYCSGGNRSIQLSYGRVFQVYIRLPGMAREDGAQQITIPVVFLSFSVLIPSRLNLSLKGPRLLWLRRIVFAVALIVALVLTIWSAAALFFDSPFPALRTPAAIAYLIVIVAAVFLLRRNHLGIIVAFAGFALVALWWF